MTDSKLIRLLKTFSKSELRDFEKFVSSSYFGRGRDLMPLFKSLKVHYPDFSSKELTIDKIYSRIYPGKKFGDAKSDSLMKTLISELYKMTLEFLSYSSFKEDENKKRLYLLDQLRKRKHYNEFEKEYDKILKQKNNHHRGEVADFIEKYFQCSAFKNYSLDRDDFLSAFEYTLAADENVVAAALVMTFMFEDLKNTSIGYNIPLRYTLMNNLLENLNTDELLNNMKENNDRFYPYVVIFYLIYKMNRHKDKKKYYYELKYLVVENKDLFSREMNYTLCSILNTYVDVNSMPDDEKDFLYDYFLENNFYKKSPDEDFHIVLFRNLVMHYSTKGDYGKLERFIEKYSSELHKDHRENMYNYSYAHLNFSRGDLEKALEYNMKVNYEVFIFKIDARILLLKIYFGLAYFEQAFSLIDATLHFIRDTKEFSEPFKNYYNEFFKNFRSLLKIKSSASSDPDAVIFLEKKIREAKSSLNNQWLLKKVLEMKD